MLSDQEIETLIKIKTNPVGPEYHLSPFIPNINHAFERGSYDNNIHELFEDVEKNSDNFFKNLKLIKKILNHESYELPRSIITHQHQMLEQDKYLLDKRKENLVSNIDYYLSDWIAVSTSIGIDISEEIKTINTIKETIQDNLISLLYKEDKKIKNYIGKIQPAENLNKHHYNHKLPVHKQKMRDNTPKSNPLENLTEFVNNPKTLLMNLEEHEQSIKYLFDKTGVYEKLNKINETIQTIIEKVRLSLGVSYLSRAEFFSKIDNSNRSTPVTDFMLSKLLEGEPVEKVLLNNHKSIKEIILFTQDNSVVMVDKNNIITPINRSMQKKTIIDDLLLNELNYILRKKPTVSKMFTQLYLNYEKDFQKAYLTAQTYLNNEPILKNNGFEILYQEKRISGKFFVALGKSAFEDINDTMNEIILNHKVKQYAHSISSNKYDELYDDKSYRIIKELYNEKIPVSELQDMIGKKMAAFKTTKEFNQALDHLYIHYTSFSEYALNKKADEHKINIISSKNNVMILHIENFKQCKAAGSTSWCISRDDYYFKSYTKDKNTQYFIYDFNKESHDKSSVIGITITETGLLRAAYYKNDDSANKDPNIDALRLEVIRNHLSHYPNLLKIIKDEVAPDTGIASKILNIFKRKSQ